jgi:hypothetical protein
MYKMTPEHWRGLLTEIGAGRSLFGSNSHDREIWNAATERAMNIVERYRDGEGLFQIVERRAKKASKP